MKQSGIFLAGEADAWYARNKAHLGERDPVCDVIDALGLKPQCVLEVGCADGWRLRKMRERYGCQVYGIDPAGKDIDHADPGVILKGTAHLYPPGIPFVDCLIFGFALYLVDREDLFYIAAEADLHLRAGGHLIIYDFAIPESPFARDYKHCDGILAYHMDNAALWLAHPWYRKVAEQNYPTLDETVTVLRKDTANAFPVRP